MSDMKCPICQTVLDKAFLSDKVRGCPKCKNIGNIDLWQELIRTRKAFETAVDGLLAVWRATDHTTKQGSIAYNVLCDLNIKPLDRIKALEQKDVK